MKVFFSSKRTIAFFAFIIIGLLFMFVKAKYVYPGVLIFIGSMICLAGIIKLTFINKQLLGNKEYVFDLIEGILNIIVGVIVVKFWDFRWVTFTCGIIFAIIPVLRVLFSKHKFNQALLDLLKYLAVIVLISSFNRVLVTRYVVSAIFLTVAVIIFITLIIKIRKVKRGEYLHEIEN